MQTIKQALNLAIKDLANASETAWLDAHILLSHLLKQPRSYLISHDDDTLSDELTNQYEILIKQRKDGRPVAYLTGFQSFWTFDLQVNQHTLIPRPETEALVEQVLKLSGAQLKVADLGTGSGAIALAIAYERPDFDVVATDISKEAIEIALKNAKLLNLKNISFHVGNWHEALPNTLFDVIVSNPPYIAEDDKHLTRLSYEPRSALVSGAEGLDDLLQVIDSSRKFLKPGGFIMLEHGFQQAKSVTSILKKLGYTNINVIKDLAGNERITIAQWSE